MEKRESIFSALNSPPPPVQSQKVPGPAPGPANDARVAGLEAAVKVLQAEIVVLKQAASRPPAPPPPPPKPEPQPELLSRLERQEAGIADIKAGLESCQTLAKRLETYISRNDLESVKFSVSETLAEFETIQRKLSGYTEEFSGIEQECRRSVGEMRGYVKNVSQKLVADRFDEYLKESVSRLSPRLAELEKTMHAGLADLSSRLMSDEVLYGKILAEAEGNLRKGLEPDMTAFRGQLKGLGEKIAWLVDEQNIVTERRVRALEARSSAFNAISARMDTLEKEQGARIKDEG
jgi:hypothetical protein